MCRSRSLEPPVVPMSIFSSRNKVRILWYGVLQAESSARSLVFEGVGAAFEVRVALVPGRGKRQNNNIEIAYFIGAWGFSYYYYSV